MADPTPPAASPEPARWKLDDGVTRSLLLQRLDARGVSDGKTIPGLCTAVVDEKQGLLAVTAFLANASPIGGLARPDGTPEVKGYETGFLYQDR